MCHRSWCFREQSLATSCTSICEASAQLLPNERFHKALELSIDFAFDNKKSSMPQMPFIFDFRNLDYDSFTEYFDQIDWQNEIGNRPVDDMVRIFYKKVEIGLNNWAPTVQRKTKSSQPPWVNRSLLHLMHQQKKSHTKYIASGRSSNLYEDYSRVRKMTKQVADQALATYTHQIEGNLRSNPKQFFNYVNDKRKSKGVPSTVKFKNSEASNEQDVANLFATFFSSIYASPQASEPMVGSVSSSTDIPPCTLCVDSISLALSKLSDSMDMGPDGLPALFLKRCASTIAKPLCVIYNRSLQLSVFPKAWKISNVRPVFKKGNRNDVTNYRCIAKLSFIAKIFEALVCDHVSFYSRPLIPTEQHGFVKKRSTTSNLVDFTTSTMNSLENGHQVDSINTDFSSAFDKIPIEQLCDKLALLGFSPSWVSWIKSYLSNRTLKVIIGNTLSNEFAASSGVPAGSHLGPVLFVLYISDIGSVIRHSKYLAYADDLKIFRKINNIEDCLLLQLDIDAVALWCVKNKLPLNEKKCTAFSFHRSKTAVIFDYMINNCKLTRPNELKDLGVWYDSKLSFINHIDRSIARAVAMLGFVMRCAREFKDPYTIKSLYCSLVRSILEYASVVWSPTYAVHIKRIESIQKRFLLFSLRHLFPLNDFQNLPPYSDRLQLIDLTMLSTRRKVADLIYFCKVLSGDIDTEDFLQEININTGINHRTQNNLIYLQFHRTNYGMQQPMARMARTFNELSHVFDFNKSIDSIRLNAIQHLKHLPN